MNFFNYLFEHHEKSDRKFVLGNKEEITFNQLFKDANIMASFIRKNLGQDKNIVVILPNSVFFITIYLAIFKSGNVCVPLNPQIEEQNLDYILKETNSTEFGFISKTLKRKHAILNKDSFIDEDKFSEILTSFTPKEDIIINRDKNDLAELIFTSGSTGMPKGVMLSHGNLIANTESIIKYLKLTNKDIIEVVMPFYYCYGLSLLHTHLRVGGSVVLNNTFIFIGSVIKDLEKYNCTGFAGVPSHFQILLRKTKNFKDKEFPSLRYVTQAGGKLHNAFIAEFLEAFPNVQMYTMYGQTEATARLSYLPPEKLSDKLGSIGKGIPDVSLRVVNENGKDVKPGETGQIIARGDNIMLGYFNDIEATNNAIKDTWLYTGDIGTVDEDGFIFLSARIKEIIKVAGKRVSPKEIEEVIVAVPDVVDCTIESFDDEVMGEALKAIVVVADLKKNTLTEDAIKSACAQSLASYKIPSVIQFIDKVNVSATGKKIKA